MQIHILPGDAAAGQFPTSIVGEKIIFRECLTDGDLTGETIDDFWETRRNFIETEYGGENYHEKTVAQFEILKSADRETEVNLWFEYELFCQVNLWFCIDLLQSQGFKNLFLVYPVVPPNGNLWDGFAKLNESEMENSFSDRIEFDENSISLGSKLWRAYRSQNLKDLETLSQTHTPVFPTLSEVCRAEIERKRDGRVEKCLREIIEEGATNFSEVFVKFREEEGVYGFGDSQVKSVYDRIFGD